MVSIPSGGLRRRTFLSGLTLGAAAVSTGALAGCGSSGSAAKGGASSLGTLTDILPAYLPVEYVKPDLGSVQGSAVAYLKYPASEIHAITDTPGTGSTITAMSPAYWPLPPGPGHNSYYDAVNKRLGATVKFSPIDGSDYAQKISALLAAKNMADVTVVPTWDQGAIARYNQAVPALFADLTDFLRGDQAKKYPFLANLPSRAWQFCAFDGRIRALPFPNGLFAGTAFYRKDLFDKLGVTPPTDADSLVALCRETTSAKDNRWALGDFGIEIQRMFGVPNRWRRTSGGKLEADLETEEFAESVAFTRTLYDAGYVHPAIKAGQTTQSKDLFESGRTLMYWDGVGAWHEAVDRNRPSNPDFDMQAVLPFAHDGGKPITLLQDPVAIMTFVNKKLSRDRVEEILRIANFCAATFGTQEYGLLNYGVDGVHSKRNASGVPVLTDKGRSEITTTYSFVVGRPDFEADVQYPDYVRSRSNWEAAAAKVGTKSPFDGLRIEEPAQYTGIRKPIDDKVNAIVRGQAPVSDLKSAVAQWRKSGGDKLRDFYQKVLSDAGRN